MIYAWLAAIIGSLPMMIVKASTKSAVKNPWMLALIWVGARVPIIAFFGVWQGVGLPNNWWPIVFAGAASAIEFALFTFALFKIDVTVASPLTAFKAVFAVLLGVFVLGEVLSSLELVLIGVVVLSTPFAAYTNKLNLRSFWDKNIFIFILAMLFLAIQGFYLNISTEDNGVPATIVWQSCAALAFSLPFLKFVPKKERNLSKKHLIPALTLGLCGALFTATATLAYADNLAISAVIIGLPLSMVFTYVLSKKYPKILVEKHSDRVYAIRFTAAFFAIGASIWLSLS